MKTVIKLDENEYLELNECTTIIVGILLLFHGIKQHAATFKEFFLEQQRAQANRNNPE